MYELKILDWYDVHFVFIFVRISGKIQEKNRVIEEWWRRCRIKAMQVWQ